MAEGPKGVFDVRVVQAYLKQSGAEFESDTVKYWYDPKTYSAAAAHHYHGQPGNNSLSSYGECICLDVGFWAGNGPKNDQNHERHREFGIVTRNVAALCRFPGQFKGEKALDSKVQNKLRNSGGLSTYEQHIQPLVDHLSSGQDQSKHDLGDVEIISALALTDETFSGERKAANDASVYVFLGDLHLPIMNDRKRTVADPGIDGEVRRYGRLTLDEQMMADVAVVGALAAEAPEVAVPAAALAGLDIWSREQLDRGFPEPDEEGWMSVAEAEQWANYYMGKNGNKGADIFQHAAMDLATFLNLLPKYKKAPLKLIQVGDFYDFWIGLKCGFKENVYMYPGVAKFVRHWKDATKTGSYGVAKALATLDALPGRQPDGHQSVEVTILPGNHDNYDRWAKNPFYQPAQGVLFSEHGHKYDSFNSDDDARLGWAITQAAFISPKIRDIEDFATGLLTRVKRVASTAAGERLERMARAADVCFTNGRTIYVMGHTHRKFLRKISVHPRLHANDVCAYDLEYLIKVGKEWLITAKNYCKKLVQRQLNRAKDEAYRCKRYLVGKIREAKRRLLETKKALLQVKAELTEMERQLLEKIKDEMNKALQQLEQAEKAGLELAKQGALQAYATMQSVETRLATLAVKAQTGLKAWALQAKSTLSAVGAWFGSVVKAAEEFAARAVAKFYALLNEVLAEMKVLMKKIQSALSDAIAKAGQVLGDGYDSVVNEAKDVWNKIATFSWSS
jgi:UDP-2,3-diacylglucosamine pyrophosphatase LpxH